MKSSDIILTIIIIIIFIGLFLFNFLSIGIKNIQNNWPEYRCNPIVMPFASMFGQNAMTNFTFCIQTMQSNYMKYLLQPVNYNLDVVGNLGGVISEAVNSARAFISNLRDFITDIVGNVFGVFLNILIEFQRITVNIKDLIGKFLATILTFGYVMEGTYLTSISTWNGAPGQMVRAICFHPNTEISMKNGEKKYIKNIELNDILKNGAIVDSVMKISNSANEKLYKINSKTNNILVTGSHLIYDISLKKYISVLEYYERNKKTCKISKVETDTLYCLITSNHTIPIGEYLFHDWEDNNKYYNI